jgi:hypothetical protein
MNDLILHLVITVTALVTVSAVMVIVHCCLDYIINLLLQISEWIEHESK